MAKVGRKRDKTPTLTAMYARGYRAGLKTRAKSKWYSFGAKKTKSPNGSESRFRQALSEIGL